MLYLGQLMILFSCVVTRCLEICPRPFPAAGRCWALQVPVRRGWSPRGRAGGSWQRVGGDGGHGAVGLPLPSPRALHGWGSLFWGQFLRLELIPLSAPALQFGGSSVKIIT